MELFSSDISNTASEYWPGHCVAWVRAGRETVLCSKEDSIVSSVASKEINALSSHPQSSLVQIVDHDRLLSFLSRHAAGCVPTITSLVMTRHDAERGCPAVRTSFQKLPYIPFLDFHRYTSLHCVTPSYHLEPSK